MQLFTVEQRLATLSAQEPIIAQLTTTPGVGRIVAASFVSVIDDAHRFRNAHQVESYVGLVPSEDSSGGKRRIGAVSKKGNSNLRALLVQSAWVILRSPNRVDPLHQWARATAQRRGRRMAVVAVARKLAGLLWAMWRDGTAYDVELTATSAHEDCALPLRLPSTARPRSMMPHERSAATWLAPDPGWHCNRLDRK